MNYETLKDKINKKTNVSETGVDLVLDALREVVYEELKLGNKVSVPKLAKFTTRLRKARKAINPRTKELMEVPEMVIPKVRISENLKRHLK